MTVTEREADAVDGTAVEVYEPPSPVNLFRTDDPVEVIERATRVANALAPVLEQRKLYKTISGKKHILVEGWQTLGAMLGVTPVCVWTRPLTEPSRGWEARVEARTLDGRTIGAAEAECLRAEQRWGSADDYAIRSMAQTRAMSKALSSVLRFIVTLAGFEGTPAEEMPDAGGGRRRPQPTAKTQEPSERPASASQKGMLNGKAKDAGLTSLEYANCLLLAQGRDPIPDDDDRADPERALAFVNRVLERLPASRVNKVLAEIKKIAKAKGIDLADKKGASK